MADIEMDVKWRPVLSTAELLLILKALGERLKPEEVEQAKTLGDALTVMRSARATTLAVNLQKNVEAMEENR